VPIYLGPFKIVEIPSQNVELDIPLTAPVIPNETSRAAAQGSWFNCGYHSLGLTVAVVASGQTSMVSISWGGVRCQQPLCSFLLHVRFQSQFLLSIVTIGLYATKVPSYYFMKLRNYGRLLRKKLCPCKRYLKCSKDRLFLNNKIKPSIL